MSRAAPHLTPAELAWLNSGVPEIEWSLMSQVESLTEGLGCLVVNDKRMGSFREAGDCSSQLFFLANQASLLGGGLRVVSDSAAHLLKTAESQQR